MKQIAYIIALVFLSSCAQIGSLSGGDKDVMPPKLVKSTPGNGDTLFKKTRIELTFNEYVELNNLPQQLVISPLVKPLPKAEIHGKTVILTFDSLLRENTTYTMYFGDGIRDYTEKNVWTENMFVFSTGPKLDSISVSGFVKNGYNSTPEGNMIVMLHSNLKDSAVGKEIPTYFAKTNKDGSFKINHIHEGSYRIFALQDMNSNYLFDLPNEKIAYNTAPLEVQQDIEKINLAAFLEKNDKQNLKSSKYINEQAYSISFRNKTINPSIEVEKEKLHHIEKFNNGDSAVIWFKSLTEDDHINIVVKDGLFTDTIAFHAKEAKNQYAAKLKPVLARKKLEVLPNDSLRINFNYPLASLNTKDIKVKKDSTFLPCDIKVSQYNLVLNCSQEESSSALLKIPVGGLLDIYGKSNVDSLSIPFTLLSESNVGELELKVDIKDMQGPYVLQLISSKGEMVREEYFSKNNVMFHYKNLIADEYQIKLLLDANGNKTWDTGNYYLHAQPEKIIFYEKPLTVRGNWEMEIQWNVIGK